MQLGPMGARGRAATWDVNSLRSTGREHPGAEESYTWRGGEGGEACGAQSVLTPVSKIKGTGRSLCGSRCHCARLASKHVPATWSHTRVRT